MNKISKSPQRNTFQQEKYIERCQKDGKEPNEDYLNLFKTAREQDEENMVNPEWQVDNMEYDLRATEWILEKVRANEVYAQNLYAAMCNNEFTRNDVWPILTEQKWSCSWRHAGGIIADMREEGDYIDWYCSGIRSADDEDNGFVGESHVTDEIRSDLLELGWIVIDEVNQD